MVRAVRAQVGDRVARGAVVLELEVPELAADAAQKAAAAAQAEREAARQQQLLADGITSARQAEEAGRDARQATAAAAAARDLLARTRVTSPIAGRVQEVMVQPGERVDAGRPLAQVVAPDTLDLVVPVPAPELARLRTGLPLDVRQDGDTAPARGWLAALAPGVDSAHQRGPGRDPGAQPRRPAAPGRDGHGARSGWASGTTCSWLPDSALVLAGDSSVVFVVGPDSVAHAAHRDARRSAPDGRTEVRGDLRAGDRVVTTGAFGLEDGMHVVARRPAAAGPRGEAHRPRPQAPGGRLPRRRAAHARRRLGAVHAARRDLSRGDLPAHRRARARRHVRGGADDGRGHPPARGGAERHPRPPAHPHAHRARLGAS